jgi:hypothetical protein
MRPLVLSLALLLTACGTYTSVIGSYRASLSRADVHAIVQIAQTIRSGHYNQMTLNALAPDAVGVDTLQGNGSYGYVAIRRGGIWKRGFYHRERGEITEYSVQ